MRKSSARPIISLTLGAVKCYNVDMSEYSIKNGFKGFGKETLVTERLILRPWRESDAEDLYEYAKDPIIGERTGFVPHKSVEDTIEVLLRKGLMCEYNRAVCLKDGKAIGSIGLINHDGTPEIGYWLGKPFWGQGLIPEAVRRVAVYVFDVLGANRLYCGYFDGNVNSRRVSEKCGFIYSHTEYDKLWEATGKIVTEHFTVLDRAKFEQNRAFYEN